MERIELPSHRNGTEFQYSVLLNSTQRHLFLAIVLSFFAIAPLFYPGYFQTHTGLVPLWNLADLRMNLGDWRWVPHIATQFDPFRSEGLLVYYLAALLPLPPIEAIKTIIGLSWLLGTVGVYLWLRRWLGNSGAVVSALLYTYLPYQVMTVYVRGAWGETLFWGMLPWVIWLTSSETEKSWKKLLFTVLAWGALGFAQLGLTIWALMLVGFFWGGLKRWLMILAALFGIGGVILLNFFLAPPDLGHPTMFTDHFLYPFQLFSAQWGFGTSRPGWEDGLSFQLGVAGVGLALITVYLWQKHSQTKDWRWLYLMGAISVLILLQFHWAAFIWNLPFGFGYRLASTLTYPWQLLGFVGLGLAILAGAALWFDKYLRQFPFLAAIILLILLASYPYLLPQFISYGDEKALLQSSLEHQWEHRITLLQHDFSVATPGWTAGLARGQTDIPLATHGPLQARDTLYLNLIWHPLQTLPTDFKIFVHLADSHDNVLAQYDGYPQPGATSQWIPGDFIIDAYPLTLPAELPPGPYQTFVGFYNEATMARLPLSDGQEKVIFEVR